MDCSPCARKWPGCVVGLVLVVALAVPSVAHATSCDGTRSLRSRIRCRIEKLSAKNSFRRPDERARAAWRRTAQAMLEGRCENIRLPASLTGYDTERLTERSTPRTLCLLHETGPETSGWGTFITHTGASRPLHVLAPHPLHDRHTGDQAVEVFLGTRARSVLVAGAPRNVAPRGTGCGDHPVSDPTHSPHTMFQPTVAALADSSSKSAVLQLHGMAASSCAGVDVYLTHGSARPPTTGGLLATLRERLAGRRPGWTVTVPGPHRTDCRLHGSRNVQARLLAGVPSTQVCRQPPAQPSARFIHVEQKPWARRSALWTAVLQRLFPLEPSSEDT